MSYIINLLLPEKLKEIFASAQQFLSGKKTYIAAAAMLVQSLAALADQVCGLNGVSAFVDMLRNIGANQTMLTIAQSLAIMGLRAGIAKAAAGTDTGAAATGAAAQ